MTSRKVLATMETADFSDCVNTGYRYTLYADGRVSAELHCRWQGSYDGARYTTEPGFVEVEGIDEDDPDNDAEARLTAAVVDADPDYDPEWRQTRKGRKVT